MTLSGKSANFGISNPMATWTLFSQLRPLGDSTVLVLWGSPHAFTKLAAHEHPGITNVSFLCV